VWDLQYCQLSREFSQLTPRACLFSYPPNNNFRTCALLLGFYNGITPPPPPLKKKEPEGGGNNNVSVGA